MTEIGAEAEHHKRLASAPGPVFISYASRDASVADELVTQLELVGVGCWIAPRNVPGGSDYGGEIVRAIRAASAVLFLFSENSNLSDHCLRELEEAIKLERPIVPVRLDDSGMGEGFEYRLSTVQWVDRAGTDFYRRVVSAVTAVRGRAPLVTVEVAQPDGHARSVPDLLATSDKRSALEGRADEGARLAGVLAEVEQTGRGRFVLVGGESGVGKTALLQQATFDAAALGYRVASATCGSFLDGVAFFPIREIMRQLGNSAEPLIRIKQLYGANSQQASMAAVAESAIAEPADRREAVLATFANLVYGIAHDGPASPQPLLLVLEDLEYVDAGSVDALLCLLARIDSGPVVVMGAHRNDIAVGTSALRILRDAVQRNTRDGVLLTIGPLRRGDYPRIIESMLGGPVRLPTRVLDQLWLETEGNALFLREIVTAVGAFGEESDPHLVLEDGVWHFVGAIEQLRTPPSVEEAIARNLQGIDDTEREYLELASVIGKQFAFDLEVGLSGSTDDEVLDALERSISQTIIRELTEPSDSFEFSHNKVREVLYNSISRLRRKRIHGKIADILASTPVRSEVERDTLVGEHLFLAERYAEASNYLNRSALSLMEVQEVGRAAVQFGRVLIALEQSGTADPVVVAATMLHRIEALKLASEYDSAVSLCMDLIATPSLSDSDRGWAFDLLGDLLWTTGDLGGGLAAYAEAEAIAERTGHTALELEVSADLVEYHDREHERLAGIDDAAASVHAELSEKYVQRQFALAEASENRSARARAYRNWAKRLRKRGDLDGSLKYYELSLAQSDPRVASHQVLISYAKTLRFVGRRDEAEAAVARVYTWSLQTGARRSLAIALYYRAILSMDIEVAPASAMSDIDAAIAIHEEIGYERGAREVRILRGEWSAAAGDWEQAIQDLNLGMQLGNGSPGESVRLAAEQLIAVDERARAANLLARWKEHESGG